MNKTGYKIYVDNIFYGEGNTSKGGAILHRVPFNSSITISNINLGNQSYYTDTEDFMTLENKTYRIILDLTIFKEFNITQEGIFGEDEKINLTLNAVGNTKNMYFCIDYSTHIIFVEVQNFTKLQGRCYNMDDLNVGEDLNIVLKYTYFGTITSDDYLKVNFLDTNDKIVQTYKLNN